MFAKQALKIVALTVAVMAAALGIGFGIDSSASGFVSRVEDEAAFQAIFGFHPPPTRDMTPMVSEAVVGMVLEQLRENESRQKQLRDKILENRMIERDVRELASGVYVIHLGRLANAVRLAAKYGFDTSRFK